MQNHSFECIICLDGSIKMSIKQEVNETKITLRKGGDFYRDEFQLSAVGIAPSP